MRARAILSMGVIGVAGLIVPVMLGPAPRLLWNATASVPVGLYRLHPRTRPMRGMLVAISPSADMARLASERGYLPLGVPLLKRVAGVDGDLVCRAGDMILVDGKPIGRARTRDRRGRPLPHWRGCAWLGPGDVFVMNAAVPDSFDGRYFGILPTASIIGRATPVWLARAPTQFRSPTA